MLDKYKTASPMMIYAVQCFDSHPPSPDYLVPEKAQSTDRQTANPSFVQCKAKQTSKMRYRPPMNEPYNPSACV